MLVEIFMACPLCLQGRISVAKEYWRHGRDKSAFGWMFKPCDGILCLDEYANVVCKRCHESIPLLKARLTCSSGLHKYETVSSLTYAKAISMASMSVVNGSTVWLQNLLKHI